MFGYMNALVINLFAASEPGCGKLRVVCNNYGCEAEVINSASGIHILECQKILVH